MNRPITSQVGFVWGLGGRPFHSPQGGRGSSPEGGALSGSKHRRFRGLMKCFFAVCVPSHVRLRRAGAVSGAGNKGCVDSE